MNKRILCTALAVVMLLGAFCTGSVPVRAVSNFTVSPQGEAMIKAFEGFNDIPKWDNKQNSVGWGCSITPEQWAVTEKNPDGTITQAAAQQLLNAAMLKHGNEVNDFANKYGLTLTQGQFDALASLCFNVGGSYLRDESTSLVKALRSGDPEWITYAVTLYSTSAGVTSYGHITRRILEMQMFLFGIYDTDKGLPEKVRYVLLDGNGGDSRYNPYGFSTDHPVSDIRCEWRSLPTGTDGNGNPFTYEFAGWFDKPVGGSQITVLDASMKHGMILYAHWRNPITGQIDDLRPGTAVDVKVKATSNVTLREGPCTYYTSIRTVYSGELLHIIRVVTGKDKYQWGLTPEGWVRLDYTNYGTTGETEEPLQPGIYATVTTSDVQIRTGPGTNYDKTGNKVINGQTYKLLATQSDGAGNNWGQMEDGNWFCLQYGSKSYATVQVITEQPPQETPTVPAPDISGAITVQSVEVSALPAKLEYILGGGDRVPDLTGGRLKVTLSNGTKKWIDMTRGMISGFDTTAPGTKTLTVTVGGKSTTFNVEVVAVNVVGLAMTTNPNKLTYLKGQDALDLTGATVTVAYNHNYSETIPVTADMVSGFDNATTGIQTIVVAYRGFTTSFNVEVVSNDAQWISMATLPVKRQYLMNGENLDLTGASIKINFSATGEETIPVTPEMVTGFDNTSVGMKRLTVTYQSFTTSFDVEIILPTVTFLNYDGTVLSSTRYEYGATVTPPAAPAKPKDDRGEYEFIGWDKEVTTVNGNATYTAQFKLLYPLGDVDKNMAVNEDDAIYLLRHVIFPDKYPLDIRPDYNKDGNVNEDDAIYLLRHVIFPDKYPLT